MNFFRTQIQQIVNRGNNLLSFFKQHWKKILTILIIVAGSGWWRYQAVQNGKPELTFARPQYQDLTKILEVSGVVDAKEKANLRFAAGGKVVYLGAQEGERVKKWQTIATIDQQTLEKQLQQDVNTYLKERWGYDDTVEDYDYDVETLDTRRTLDKAEWDLRQKVLDVEIRDIAIKNTVLSAPFTGVLVSSPTDVAGVNVLATEAFELVNPKTLIFKAAIDEADIAQISLEQKGNIYLDSYLDEPINSQVSYIAYKSSDSTTGTVFVVEFPLTGGQNSSQNTSNQDTHQKYRLGMNGDVEIILDTRENVLTIPFEATRERDSQVFVDVRTEGDAYEARQITTGLETADYVEVLSGLSENDEVLIPEN